MTDPGPPRGIIVPRWGGDRSVDWYPALLAKTGRRVEVCELDAPGAPTIAGSTKNLSAQIEAFDPTILIGHSVGCQVVLRCLASSSKVFDAVILVAAWFTVDEPWPALQPWIDTPMNLAAARDHARRMEVYLSDNDPFTADHESSAALFADRLGAEVTTIKGAAHFNDPHQADILRRLTALLAAHQPDDLS